MVTPERRRVLAWSIYDLANTIFSFNILSFYFPVYLEGTLGGTDTHWSVAFSSSMLLVALLSPLAGAISDRYGRRVPFLLTATLVCVAATSLLGVPGLTGALVLVAIANLAFQLGLVFYDALLPEVSTKDTVGAVGGAGVSLGYVGSFIGLGTGALLLATLEDPHPWIFAATAGLFLLFAIPCFLFVERGTAAGTRAGTGPRGFKALARTWSTLRERSALSRFLVARFVYTDAANTLILFMGIYATREIGFSEALSQGVLAVGIAAAIAGALGFGRWVDDWRAKPVLQIVMGVWVLALGLAAAVPLTALPAWLFWVAAALAGAALGGTWAADRPLMLELTPEGRVGEFYGVYGMVGRFAAVLGPLVWAGVVDGLGWGRPAAVGVLLAAIVIASGVLRGVEA